MDTPSETQSDLQQIVCNIYISSTFCQRPLGGSLTEPTRAHMRLPYFINKVDTHTHKATGKRSKIFNSQDAFNLPGPDSYTMSHGCSGGDSKPIHVCLKPCKNSSCLCVISCEKISGSLNLLRVHAHTQFLGSAMLHLCDDTGELARQRRVLIGYKN